MLSFFFCGKRHRPWETDKHLESDNECEALKWLCMCIPNKTQPVTQTTGDQSVCSVYVVPMRRPHCDWFTKSAVRCVDRKSIFLPFCVTRHIHRILRQAHQAGYRPRGCAIRARKVASGNLHLWTAEMGARARCYPRGTTKLGHRLVVLAREGELESTHVIGFGKGPCSRDDHASSFISNPGDVDTKALIVYLIYRRNISFFFTTVQNS